MSPSGTAPSGASPPGARRRRAVPRQAVGLLLAAACVVAAGWYVPRVIDAEQRLLTGTVTSTGIVDLNFAGNGRVGSVLVRLGQQVRKGTLLATETAPAAAALIRADRAAIAADQARLAQLAGTGTGTGSGTPADVAAARARLARDQASLASDQAAAAAARIVAPAGGTIVAINGQPGETAGADGVQDYADQGQPGPATGRSASSLLPQAPPSGSRSGGADSGLLPLIELRDSTGWDVVVLIPGNSATSVRPGQAVTVAVPAAHLAGLRGRIEELPAASPVTTATGVAYEVVVTMLDHPKDPPLTGMTADVQLGG